MKHFSLTVDRNLGDKNTVRQKSHSAHNQFSLPEERYMFTYVKNRILLRNIKNTITYLQGAKCNIALTA